MATSVHHLAKTAHRESRAAALKLRAAQRVIEDGFTHAIHCGEVLKLAKLELGQAGFAAWVADCGLSVDLANAYMRFADGGISGDTLAPLLAAMTTENV